MFNLQDTMSDLDGGCLLMTERFVVG